MELIQLLLKEIANNALIFMLMYLFFVLYFGKHWIKIHPIAKSFLSGLGTGLIAFFSMWNSIVLHQEAYLDSKFIIILITGVLFGWEAIVVTVFIILLAGVGFGVYEYSVFIPQILSTAAISLLLAYLLGKKGILFVKKYVYLFYILSTGINIIWGILWTDIETVLNAFDHMQIIHLFVSLAMKLILIYVFLHERMHRENEADLFKAKLELVDKNEHLSQIYEELTATEEELRVQNDELNRSQALLEKKEQRNQMIFRAGNEILWDYDPITNEFNCGTGLADLFEVEKINKETVLPNYLSCIHDEDIETVKMQFKQLQSGEIDNYVTQHRIMIGDRIKWIAIKVVALRDQNNQLIHVAGAITNITDEKSKEAELHHLAYFDMLTGLPNRKNLYERYDQALCDESDSLYYFLYLDLDNFKNINDTLGHTAGDYLLIELGKRLMQLRTEKEFIARVGGDEFIIVIQLSEGDQKDYITNFAMKVMEAMKEKYVIHDLEYLVTSSIGIACYPTDGKSLEEIMMNADAALYHAKDLGKNQYSIYNKSLHDGYFERLNLENLLRDAIQKGEIKAHF